MIKPSKTHILTAAALSAALMVPGAMTVPANAAGGHGIVHTAHRVMLVGKKVGVTNAYIYGHDGQELLNLEIRVDRDMNGLKSLLNKHLPGNELGYG